MTKATINIVRGCPGRGIGVEKVIKNPTKKWTEEQSSLLTATVLAHGDGVKDRRFWSKIAGKVQGKTGKQCRERWQHHLRPNLNKQPWTVGEEYILARAHSIAGSKWTEVVKVLPDRAENTAKNHYNSTFRAKPENRSKSFFFIYTQMSKAMGPSDAVFQQAVHQYSTQCDVVPLSHFTAPEQLFHILTPLSASSKGQRKASAPRQPTYTSDDDSDDDDAYDNDHETSSDLEHDAADDDDACTTMHMDSVHEQSPAPTCSHYITTHSHGTASTYTSPFSAPHHTHPTKPTSTSTRATRQPPTPCTSAYTTAGIQPPPCMAPSHPQLSQASASHTHPHTPATQPPISSTPTHASGSHEAFDADLASVFTEIAGGVIQSEDLPLLNEFNDMFGPRSISRPSSFDCLSSYGAHSDGQDILLGPGVLDVVLEENPQDDPAWLSCLLNLQGGSQQLSASSYATDNTTHLVDLPQAKRVKTTKASQAQVYPTLASTTTATLLPTPPTTHASCDQQGQSLLGPQFPNYYDPRSFFSSMYPHYAAFNNMYMMQQMQYSGHLGYDMHAAYAMQRAYSMQMNMAGQFFSYPCPAPQMPCGTPSSASMYTNPMTSLASRNFIPPSTSPEPHFPALDDPEPPIPTTIQQGILPGCGDASFGVGSGSGRYVLASTLSEAPSVREDQERVVDTRFF